MADGDIIGLIDSWTPGSPYLYSPCIEWVAGNIFVICANQRVATFQVGSGGVIVKSIISTSTISMDNAQSITKTAPGIFAVLGNAWAPAPYGWLVIKTIRIADDGTINTTPIDTHTYSAAIWSGYTPYPRTNKLPRLGTTNNWIVTAEDSITGGTASTIVYTIPITPAGIIGDIIDYQLFTPTLASQGSPSRYHIKGNVYAVIDTNVGTGSDFTVLRTFTITSAGAISDSIDTWVVSQGAPFQASMGNIAGNYWAVFCQASDATTYKKLKVTTIIIDDSGYISPPLASAILDETALNGYTMGNLVSKTGFGILTAHYTTSSPIPAYNARLRAVSVEFGEDGSITRIASGPTTILTSSEVSLYQPSVLEISDSVFLAAMSDSGAGSVTLATYGITTLGEGESYPANPMTRVSGLVHRWSSGKGQKAVYQLEIMLGGITSQYASPVKIQQPEPTIPEQTLLPQHKFTGTYWNGYPLYVDVEGWFIIDNDGQKRYIYPQRTFLQPR